MANDFSGDANCVAVWNLEQNGNDSKGGNDLTEVNTPSYSTDSQESTYSANLNGSNEYLNIDDADLDSGFPLKNGDPNRKISVCFWFKADSDNSATRYIYSKYEATNGKRSFAVVVQFIEAGNPLSILHGYNNGEEYEFLQGRGITTGRWYHVGATYDDSDRSYRIRVWDDTAQDVEEYTGTATNAINVGDADVRIGTRTSPASWCYFDGHIDEVVVFNDILTSDEIDQIRQGIYPSGAPPTPPTITSQPDNLTVNVGQTATFDVTAEGTAPLSYQWRKDGSDISGANSSSYTTPPVTLADNGAQFDVVVTNSAGRVTSNSATLTVTESQPGEWSTSGNNIYYNASNVGIGTTNPQSTLAVNGTIRAKEVKVETGWSDFVFEENYNLLCLAKVESYIKENKHLPDIPSVKEIQEDGLSMGEMMAKQMQKIEELTLYIIELEKRISSLEKND